MSDFFGSMKSVPAFTVVKACSVSVHKLQKKNHDINNSTKENQKPLSNLSLLALEIG